jgi:regulator of protease activity HflC (stomatin/prohibitin superfamily)
LRGFGRKLLPYREPGLHYKLPWPVDDLTRIKARRVRVVEIGFRSNVAGTSGARGLRMECPAQQWPLSESFGGIR